MVAEARMDEDGEASPGGRSTGGSDRAILDGVASFAKADCLNSGDDPPPPWPRSSNSAQRAVSPRIDVAVSMAQRGPARRRAPRAEQQAACRRLLSTLLQPSRSEHPGITASRHVSFSHSRVASAVAAGTHLPVGIDIEWMAPHRDTEKILEVLCGISRPSLPSDAFYRAWTFYEAYFKACGTIADAEILDRVIDTASTDPFFLQTPGRRSWIGVIQSIWECEFMLSVVWMLPQTPSPVDHLLVFHGYSYEGSAACPRVLRSCWASYGSEPGSSNGRATA